MLFTINKKIVYKCQSSTPFSKTMVLAPSSSIQLKSSLDFLLVTNLSVFSKKWSERRKTRKFNLNSVSLAPIEDSPKRLVLSTTSLPSGLSQTLTMLPCQNQFTTSKKLSLWSEYHEIRVFLKFSKIHHR